jgi:hypothetical protein
MLNELLAQWQLFSRSADLPSEPVLLWRSESRSISISNKAGPAVPYPSVRHEDGSRNHGYRRVKGDPDAVLHIPEVADWPEFGRFLITVNHAASPIESVGCEKCFSPIGPSDDATVRLGSYVDLIFTDLALNEQPENLLLLASHLAMAAKDCEKWWADVEIELERYKGIAGAKAPWGLMVKIGNAGRNEQEARKFWGETLMRLGNAVAKLPRDFRFRATNTEPEMHAE